MTKIAKNTGVQRLKLLKYRCAATKNREEHRYTRNEGYTQSQWLQFHADRYAPEKYDYLALTDADSAPPEKGKKKKTHTCILRDVSACTPVF